MIAVGVFYLTSLQGVFLFDDFPAIFKNTNVTGSRTVFSGHRWLVNLTFRINWLISGDDPVLYHVANLLIHIGSALLLFGVVRRTLRRVTFNRQSDGRVVSALSAFSVALIWAVHPLATQGVSYVCQRYESLMGLCMLGAFYCFVRGIESDRPRSWFNASLVALMAGMACKEVMAVVPVLLLAYDYVFCERDVRELSRKRGLFHIASFAALLVLLMYQIQLAASQIAGLDHGSRLGDASWYRYAYTQGQVILHYIRLAAWPDALCFDYGLSAAEYNGMGLSAVLLNAIVLCLSLVGVLRRKWWGFVGIVFYAVLAPTSSVIPVADLAVEHRMYIPLIPLVGVFVYCLYAVCQKARSIRILKSVRPIVLFVALVVSISLALGLRTSARNMIYWSEVTMWQDVCAKRPDNLRARNDLASALSEQGAVSEALIEYREVIARVPADLRQSLDSGQAMVTGWFKKSSPEYAYFVACANLGTMYCNQCRDYESAFEWYLRALRVAPFSPEVRRSAKSLLTVFGHEERELDRVLNDAIVKSVREYQQ